MEMEHGGLIYITKLNGGQIVSNKLKTKFRNIWVEISNKFWWQMSIFWVPNWPENNCDVSNFTD